MSDDENLAKRGSKLTSKKIKFIERYAELNDSEVLKEILFAHTLQIEKLERIRTNTSILVWWLVGIPIILFIIIFFFGGLSGIV